MSQPIKIFHMMCPGTVLLQFMYASLVSLSCIAYTLHASLFVSPLRLCFPVLFTSSFKSHGQLR